jgi:hypothetical protein
MITYVVVDSCSHALHAGTPEQTRPATWTAPCPATAGAQPLPCCFIIVLQYPLPTG